MMRPSYWLKNILVFVPAYFGNTLFHPDTALRCFQAFVAISAMASACYVVNDLADRTRDALHPDKQRRAVASGKVTTVEAALLAAVLFACAVLMAWYWLPSIIVPLLAYAAGSTLYSLVLKWWRVLDVVWLAVLHAVRLVIGGAAAGVILSNWLLGFAALFFISLATAKRVSELVRDRNTSLGPVRPYRDAHARPLEIIGTMSGIGALGVLCLYARQFTVMPEHYSHPIFLWSIVGVTALWLWYFWRAALSGQMSGDPVGFALSDRISLCIGVAVFGFMTLARS
jgi:4-hydroxybenzoate polyprenyltransferase